LFILQVCIQCYSFNYFYLFQLKIYQSKIFIRPQLSVDDLKFLSRYSKILLSNERRNEKSEIACNFKAI